MIQPFVFIFGGNFTTKQVKRLKEVCTPTLRRAKDIATLNEIIRLHRPQVFITIGADQRNFPNLFNAPLAERTRWMHYRSTEEFMSKLDLLVNIFVNSVIRIRDEQTSETVSAFTTSYNSKKFINRPLESLLKQTHSDWEWVIYDDSDGDENWELLKKVRARDPARIRIFRSDGNSGVIGNVKQIASALCRGDFVLELDHDDELSPDAFENLVGAARRFPKAGFFYSDYCFIHEDGSNTEHTDGFALGFGGYRRKWNEQFDKWTNISRTVPVTDITIRYLVGCPNHYRAWRASTFREIGGWCPDFHVADDYEILVRTFLHTEMVRVSRKSYTQYVNTPSKESQGKHNNFTWIRNAEIQKLWRSLSRSYNDRIHERIVTLQGYDPYYSNWESGAAPIRVAYHRTAEHYNYLNKVYEPRDQDDSQPLVFVVFCYEKETSSDKGTGTALFKLCQKMHQQTYKNLEVMIVSAGIADIVEPWMRRMVKQNSSEQMAEFVRDNVCYWNFDTEQSSNYPYYMLINHALKRINTARHVLFVHDDADNFSTLPDDFVAKSMKFLELRDDVHGVVGDSVPHLLYRSVLHQECGYLDDEHVDLLAVLKAQDSTNIVEFDSYVNVNLDDDNE